MNVIFLQEGYDPKPDANSICAKNIIEVLKKRGDNVFVICDGVEGTEDKFSKDTSIIHVKVDEELSFYRRNIWGKIDTILRRIFSIPIWPIRFPKKVKKYVVVAEELLNKLGNRERTVIISVYRPAEMVAVGYILKNKYKYLTWVIYSLDGIDTMVNLKHSAWIDKREREWNMIQYEHADYVIQMRSNYDFYSNSLFSKFLSKTIIADLPLITNTSDMRCLCQTANNKVKLLYGGAFYRGLREPYYLMSWFKELLNYREVEFNCYTKSPFQPFIDQVCLETGGLLKRYDYILPDEMDIQIHKSDVLINIGNAKSSMVPSKLFVYISARKPIIHFINDEKDSCLPYLRRYPLALIINQNECVEKTVKDTLMFFDNVIGNSIQYRDLVNSFPENIPDYTVKELIERINPKN